MRTLISSNINNHRGTDCGTMADEHIQGVLPSEILQEIMRGLSQKDICNVRQVCKAWCTSAGEFITRLNIPVGNQLLKSSGFFTRFPAVTHLELTFSNDASQLNEAALSQFITRLSKTWNLKELTLKGHLPQLFYGKKSSKRRQTSTLRSDMQDSSSDEGSPNSNNSISSFINYDIFAAASSMLPNIPLHGTCTNRLRTCPPSLQLQSQKHSLDSNASFHIQHPLAATALCLRRHPPPHPKPYAFNSLGAAKSQIPDLHCPARPEPILTNPFTWSTLSSLVTLRIHDQKGFLPPYTLLTIATLPHLQVLDLNPTRPLMVGVADLASGLRSVAVGDKHIAALSRASGLTELRLGCSHHLTGSGVRGLSCLKSLQVLDLGEGINAGAVSGEDMQTLSSLLHLTQLSMSRVGHPAANVPSHIIACPPDPWAPVLFSRGFSALSHLHLAVHHSLEPQLLQNIACLPGIVRLELHLSDLPYSNLNAALYALRSLPSLQTLILSNLVLYDVHLVMISTATQISSLELRQVDVRTRAVHSWTHLAPLCQLQSFTFTEWNNPVFCVGNLAVLSDEDIQMLADCWPLLSHFNYQGKVSLTDASVEALSQMTDLEDVSIHGTDGTTCLGCRPPTATARACPTKDAPMKWQPPAAEPSCLGIGSMPCVSGRSPAVIARACSGLDTPLQCQPLVLEPCENFGVKKPHSTCQLHSDRPERVVNPTTVMNVPDLGALEKIPDLSTSGNVSDQPIAMAVCAIPDTGLCGFGSKRSRAEFSAGQPGMKQFVGRKLEVMKRAVRAKPCGIASVNVMLKLPRNHRASRDGRVSSCNSDAESGGGYDSDCSINWSGNQTVSDLQVEC